MAGRIARPARRNGAGLESIKGEAADQHGE